MEVIQIEGKEHILYTIEDIANIKGCCRRTVQIHAEKLYGPSKKGKKRLFSEEQKDKICNDIKEGRGRPKIFKE